MRNDVIRDRCDDESSVRLAESAERLGREVGSSALAPRVIVATRRRSPRPSLARFLCDLFVLFAAPSTARHKLLAAWRATRFRWRERHRQPLKARIETFRFSVSPVESVTVASSA